MITRVLVATAVIGLAGAGAAAPAVAEPGSFGDIGCTCSSPDPHPSSSRQDQIGRGVQQGLNDTDRRVAQR